jgi:hypothetical protein
MYSDLTEDDDIPFAAARMIRMWRLIATHRKRARWDMNFEKGICGHLVSDGLDVSQGFRGASPFQSIDLDRAIAVIGKAWAMTGGAVGF